MHLAGAICWVKVQNLLYQYVSPDLRLGLHIGGVLRIGANLFRGKSLNQAPPPSGQACPLRPTRKTLYIFFVISPAVFFLEKEKGVSGGVASAISRQATWLEATKLLCVASNTLNRGKSVIILFNMNTAIIIHGTEGYPEENWFPWLKQELQQEGYEVIVPQFPSPPIVAAKISEWFDVLKGYENKVNEDTLLIGHSLGGIFTLRILERLNDPVRGAFLIGTPIGVRPILNYDRDSEFSGFDFNWEKIKQNAKHFVVFQSDDDPYVGLDNGKQLANKLGVELNFVPNAGHFNKKAGYTKFSQLLEQINRVIE